MINLINISYIIAVTAFFAGIIILTNLMTDNNLKEEHNRAFVGLLLIPIFGLFTYSAMAFDLGFVTINSISVSIPRYINWLVTIPVIIGFLGYIARASRKLIASIIISTIVSILLIGYATILVSPIKWVFFGISIVISTVIITAIYVFYPKYVTEKRLRLFKQLQNYIVFILIGYPLIWLLSPTALEFLSFAEFSLIASYLDIIAKIPYLYFIWNQKHIFRD